MWAHIADFGLLPCFKVGLLIDVGLLRCFVVRIETDMQLALMDLHSYVETVINHIWILGPIICASFLVS